MPAAVTTTAVSLIMTPVRIGMPASVGRCMFGYALIRAITGAAAEAPGCSARLEP
jgi:hypothetical protein